MFKILLSLVFFLVPFFGKDVWNGSDYAKNSSVQLSHAEKLLSRLDLKGNERILDVGCGNGKITALLAQKVGNGVVIGIDPSISMLEQAKRTYLPDDFPNLFFYESTADAFKAEPFDHIISIHVMHWIKDQGKALKNMHDLLKEKGKIHLIFAPSKEGLPFHKALQKTLQNWKSDFVDFENSQQTFDMETYRKMMVRSGFHIESIQYVYHETMHENSEKLRDWIKQWLPYRKHLPLLKQDPFLDELMHHYLSEIEVSFDSGAPVYWGEYVFIMDAVKN